MKQIDIKNQPRLSLARTFRLTINGIRYRLFRSAVTMVVISVAVAFMMNILTESLIKRSVASATRDEIKQSRLAVWWVAHLSQPGAPELILREVAESMPGSPLYRETQRLAGLSDSEMATWHAQTVTLARRLAWLEGLSYAHRRRLVHNAEGVGIFDRLQEAEPLARFWRELAVLTSLELPGTQSEWEADLAGWPAQKARLLALQAARAEAIGKLALALADQPLLAALSEAGGAFGQAINAAGFVLDEATAKVVATQAQDLRLRQKLEEALDKGPLKKEIAAYRDLLPRDVNTLVLWRLLGDEAGAQWLVERLAKHGVAVSASAAELQALARQQETARNMLRAERLGEGTGGGFMGIGQRMTWLVLVSMVVCIVGIANAMLMTVTERFREIATLKCLGALDGFIMLIFVLEASMLGVVGGLIGSVAGCLLGLGRAWFALGNLVGRGLPLGDLGTAIALTTSVGIILAALAAVYPSLKAARLAPMEAMRIE